jgi:hypothetical protein
VTQRVLDDYERLFKRARVRELSDEGVRAGRTTNAVPTRSDWWIDGLRTRNFVTQRVLDDYERLFKRARVLELSDEGVRVGRTTNAVPTRSMALVHHAGASAGR